jgi:hypothetical protein
VQPDNSPPPALTSISLCCALEDDSIAAFLVGFLKANFSCAVSHTEAVVCSGRDLFEATERALSADVALVLLSSASVPRVWPSRSEWERVFVDQAKEFQTRLGFVQVEGCNFPSGLRNQYFFDASKDPLTAAREIKRWLLWPDQRSNRHPALPEDLELLRRAVADQPGTATDIAAECALQFATECSEEFEAVYRFDCRARSRAGIVGDIGSALGLRMSGKLEQNCTTLTEWCATRRVLFVLAGVGDTDRPFITPGGLASAIFTTAPVAGFAGGIESGTRAAIRKFHESAEAGDRIHFGRAAVTLLETQQRFAEALELLDMMADTARRIDDAQVLRDVETRRFWVRNDLGDDGGSDRAVRASEGVQLPLPFVG